MTAADPALAAAAEPTTSSTRSAGVAAVLYVVLLVTGVAVLGTPEGDADDATWVAFFSDKGSRQQVLTAGLLLVAAGLAFVVAVAGIAGRFATGSRAILLALFPVVLWLVWLLAVAVVMRRPPPSHPTGWK